MCTEPAYGEESKSHLKNKRNESSEETVQRYSTATALTHSVATTSRSGIVIAAYLENI